MKYAILSSGGSYHILIDVKNGNFEVIATARDKAVAEAIVDALITVESDKKKGKK